MKKLAIIILLLASITSMGQHQYRMFDGISFLSGGVLYKVKLYNDHFALDDTTYYSFPGFGTTHSTAAFGDHLHTGVYEPTIGIGTTNQYWRGDKTWQSTPTSSQWISNGSKIYYNTGNVGIGVTNPLSKLHILGTMSIASGGMSVGISASSSGSAAVEGYGSPGIYGSGGTSYGVNGVATSGYGVFGVSFSGWGGYFRGNSTGRGILCETASSAYPSGAFMGGNVGIGTSSPAYKLHNMGTTWLDSLLCVKYLPWGAGSERIIVWDSLSKQFKKRPMPSFSMTYPGIGIAKSTGSGWATSLFDSSAYWNQAYGWGNHASVGYLTSFTETDPLVYSWAKAATKPTYTYSEVGAAASGHNHSGVYEPVISKSTGFLKWTGYAWLWDNSTYLTSQYWSPVASGINFNGNVGINVPDDPIAPLHIVENIGAGNPIISRFESLNDTIDIVHILDIEAGQTAPMGSIGIADGILYGHLDYDPFHWGRMIFDDGSNISRWDAAYSHISNTSNPHSVSKAQVGLSNVTDNAQVKLSDSIGGVGHYMSWYDGTKGLAGKASIDAYGNVLIGDTAKVKHILYENNYSTTIPEEGAGSSGTNGEYVVLMAATNIAYATVVYIDTDGKAAICNAASIATCPFAFAISAESVTAGSYGKFMTRGTIWGGTWQMGIGQKLYVTSGGSGNNVGPSAPGASNNVNMPIGFVMRQQVFYFMGNINSIEHL